jgi:hypothetical protein
METAPLRTYRGLVAAASVAEPGGLHVVHLYGRDATEAAEVLGLAAALIEAFGHDYVQKAVAALMQWPGDDPELRRNAAMRLKAVAAEMRKQAAG